MYRAKENGRGGFELFDAVMRGHAGERLRVENDLRRALEAGDELIAHYQPIVTLDGGEVVGVEALARWNHPERGLVPPGEFIPVAEESGADPRHRRAGAAPRLRRGGAAGTPRATAGRSASRSTSRRARSPRRAIAAMVAAVLAETGLDPAPLTLEITEGVLVAEPRRRRRRSLDLKALGLRLVLDDFGTGYSSLAYLRRFPIDGLKIDRRFIAAMDTSTEDRTIVEAIVRWPRACRSTSWPRASRRSSRRTTSCASAASTRRASTSPGRCPRPTWRRCSTTACPMTSTRRGWPGRRC